MSSQSSIPFLPVASALKPGTGPRAVSPDARRVAQALALLWTYRPRTAVYNLLALLGFKRESGAAFTQDDVRRGIVELRERGWLKDMPHREGYFRLSQDCRSALYREILDTVPRPALKSALQRLDSFSAENIAYRWPVYDLAATVALVRLELLSGASGKELERLRELIERSLDWSEILWTAVFPAFDGNLFERITPEWRWDLASAAVAEVNFTWRPDLLPVCEWGLAKLDAEPDTMPEHARLALAEFLMHRGAARAAGALDGLDSGAADALRACLIARQGRWGDAQVAFEAAFKRRQAEAHARKRVLPASVAWLYPLALLAQETPKHLELARKFCLGEAGKRAPSPHAGWGRWVHAIGVRLGDVALDASAFELRLNPHERAGIDTLWKMLLAAWLERDAISTPKPKADSRGAAEAYAEALRKSLRQCGFEALVGDVDAAADVLGGREPPARFFISGPREQWRSVLSALQALGQDQETRERSAESTRILWSVRVGKQGRLESVEPFEQKRGPRGWTKPKPLSLAKIAGNERLPPWDAKVARAIRPDRGYGRRWEIDRAAAIMALVGHPAVVLEGAPQDIVDVVEGTPEVEVVKEGDGYVMQVTPSLRADDRGGERDGYHPDSDQRRETDALRMITVVRESSQRLQVIRMTAAQRRAAQLVAGRLALPASAREELQSALRALAGHFQVHTDHVQAAREVESESRLRAELAPLGPRLTLRLVVAPLGIEGPRLTPGVGRARLMAALAGETVGTKRDLGVERANVDSVLEALPHLDEPADAAGGYEWTIEDPEHALATVEALPKLAAVAAVDWPKGKPVRVVTVDTPQVGVVVTGERDWFRLRGKAPVDERLVLDFDALLSAAQSKSRFVPMGDGVFVALTSSLKQRLADLASVVETDRDGVRVPRLAAAWVAELLEGAPLESDDEFRATLDRLRSAQDEFPPVPKTLEAELRAYQVDGYQWAMRLASAGLGGCLADDMGLGKTLQGLAVLLARGERGAALVVAPTSVCGNWFAETRRFAPTLNPLIYGEGERDTLVATAGPMDVIIVSYALLQQAQERFAGRRWHTLIADEAQAIKNASAKRSLAVFDLDADFRLALSGTPVENRLAELWSIMRFVNPGLLGTLSRFTERFATPIERDRDRDVQHTLKRLIGPFVLRRTKAQVLQELPPRTELNIAVAPEEAEAAHYEALRRQAGADVARALSSEPAGQARMNILAELTRLRRAACDPRLVSPNFELVGAKTQAFADLAVELAANGHRALVFSQFVDFLELLRRPLDAAGIPYQYLDGGTPAAERTRRVAAFQAGHGQLFLISLKAGGFGLNLTAADYVLITDPWWNPAAEDQAMGRAHRIGQSRPVTVYRLVTKGTVEERIVELHQEKRALAESILADGDAAVPVSTDDLIALIRGD